MTRALFFAAWACAVAVLAWPDPPTVSRADMVRSTRTVEPLGFFFDRF
jgi:hypothetical protein